MSTGIEKIFTEQRGFRQVTPMEKQNRISLPKNKIIELTEKVNELEERIKELTKEPASEDTSGDEKEAKLNGENV